MYSLYYPPNNILAFFISPIHTILSLIILQVYYSYPIMLLCIPLSIYFIFSLIIFHSKNSILVVFDFLEKIKVIKLNFVIIILYFITFLLFFHMIKLLFENIDN
jgi:hypothetical protein